MQKNYGDKLKVIAEKILRQTKIDRSETFGSVIAILMVISIILTAIRILQECNKNKLLGKLKTEKYTVYGNSIKELSKKRGWFTRMRIKKIIRRELNKEDYAKYALPLTEAILNVGETLTEDEIITLVEASNV